MNSAAANISPRERSVKRLASAAHLFAQRRFVQLAATTAAFGAGGLGFVVVQALALRLMSRDEVGRFVLAYGVVSVGQAFTGLGLSQTLARTVAQEPGQVVWRRAAWQFTVVSAVPLGLAASIVALAIPGLRAWGVSGVALLALAMASQTLLAVESSFRRAASRFVSGAFLAQGAPLVLALFLAPLLLVHPRLGAKTALVLLLLVQVLLSVASMQRRSKEDLADSRSVEARAEFRLWLTSSRQMLGGFWATGVIAITYRWLDRFVVAAALPLSALGDYQSLLLVTTVFDLFGVSLGYINLPRYANAGRWDRRNMVFLALLAALATATTAAVAVVAGPLFLLSWNTRLVATLGALVIVGILRLVYAEATAVVGALSSPRGILQFSLWMAGLLAVGAAMTALLAIRFGILGAAVGSASVWSLRVGVAIWFARR